MKRFLRVVSAAALPALVLGACGSGSGTDTGSTEAESTGGAASAAAAVVKADDCADPEGAKAPITGWSETSPPSDRRIAKRRSIGCPARAGCWIVGVQDAPA